MLRNVGVPILVVRHFFARQRAENSDFQVKAIIGRLKSEMQLPLGVKHAQTETLIIFYV